MRQCGDGEPCDDGSSSHGAGIGIPVGIFIVIVALAVYSLWRLQRHRQTLRFTRNAHRHSALRPTSGAATHPPPFPRHQRQDWPSPYDTYPPRASHAPPEVDEEPLPRYEPPATPPPQFHEHDDTLTPPPKAYQGASQ
ncbi:uncharacterized protein MRET_3722 [Malassezia restricta]|uniref:uncharacterized protein n=1 Tax=Malassezia restricta TaxID=76775 RepID=UPI000DD1362F|nr:uncharacterized protein MRET_3722 [Malassezia restricta]AXA51535.1 uncharacterized protein MRET_3722 [Malassezia restricta]